MRDRGKAVEPFTANFAADNFNYSAASEIPCRKHPHSSSVGICPFCLKDRLVKLVCSECGEQRLSSCSCSDVSSSSYRNSCSTVEIGSVGRVSFLIENEKSDQQQFDQKVKREAKPEQVIFLRRSSSSCVEVKKSNGFWKIKRLFRKKRKESRNGGDRNGDFSDDKSEIWVPDVMGVSRSRSLCSFRGGRHNDLDEGSECAFSSAKISDVTSGVFLESDKQWGFEFEHRKSGFRGLFDGENGFDFRGGRRGGGGGHDNLVELDRVRNMSIFPAKESDFSAMDESAFIDLKFDLSSSEFKELSAARVSGASDSGGVYKGEGGFGNGGTPANLRSCVVLGNSGSCRITANERGLKRGGRSHKVWKWIFKYNPANRREESNSILKS